jgi:ribosomal protein S18 acetylase RimI-like enzyme
MTHRFEFLSKDRFPQIYQTFREAFADYYVDMSQVTERILFSRAIKNGVEFGLCVGVFDGPKMVGATLVGVDQWKGELSAFDIATGIIPAYRGKGIAAEMFAFAAPGLERRGVKTFVLEVLQVNERAVKAYQRAGFRVAREFDCYTLEVGKARVRTDARIPLQIERIDRDALSMFVEHTDWQPSWENSFASIDRIPDEVVAYGAFTGGRCAGILVYYPLLNWVMSIVVKREHRGKGVARCLISHFLQNLDPDRALVRLNNVDRSDTAMSSLLQKTGFELIVSQYEMECDLSTRSNHG